MTDTDFSRRRFLGASLALGCSAAASPFVTPVTLAVTPGDNRLVVIVLRGAMDGLDVVQPIGDRALAQHRKHLSTGEAGGARDLDGFFMLHPELAGLMPLWQAGELSFAHAVSTPYRDKRSHFDGQDLLENGGNSPDGGMTPGPRRLVEPDAVADAGCQRGNRLCRRAGEPVAAVGRRAGIGLVPGQRHGAVAAGAVVAERDLP